MRDSILVARLDALQQKLDRVPDWLELGLRGVQVDPNLQASLDMGINQEARRQANAVVRVRRELEAAGENDEAALEVAWRKYDEIDVQSQDIFRECLELIGGLAIRDNNLDKNIYAVADELIRNCATTSTGAQWLSFTVPAQREREAMKKVMGRIVRLRFPEWTIWSLPLTAHEYGHEVVQERNILESFVEDQAKEWNEYHLDEILADSFATYTMGPAYVCTAILLRLNPSGAYIENGSRLADAKRAHVIFAVLRRMNDEANKAPLDRDPYKDIIERLEQQWKTVLGRIEQPGELGPVDAKRLEHLVDTIIGEIFPDVFRPTGRYSHGEHGWKLATTWANDWYAQLEANQNLDVPDLSTTNKLPELRDALNAAWLCRSLSEQDKVRDITEVAYTLCSQIRVKRHPEQGQGYNRSLFEAVQPDVRDPSRVDASAPSQLGSGR